MTDELPEWVMCPLVDAVIEDIDCIENSDSVNEDVANGMIMLRQTPTGDITNIEVLRT